MPEGTVLAPGSAEGRALVLSEPLSFWGGVDPVDGRITDVHHPRHGESVSGRVLVMPSGRGSSSSSSVLVEAIRRGSGPVAIVLAGTDPILALSSIVAAELYGIEVPVVVLREVDYATIRDGTEVALDATGSGVALRVRGAAPRPR